MPDRSREPAGLPLTFVAIVGAGECLEVWDRVAWESEDETSPDRINELAAGLVDRPARTKK